MLSENNCMIYAVPNDVSRTMHLSGKQLVPVGETPLLTVQVLGYSYDYHDNTAVDPLTAILSLSEKDKQDPRVESAINEILEEHLL